MKTLAGKIAVVTGSSRGIGFAIAKALVEKGANVVLTGRDGGRLADATSTLNNAAGRRAAYAVVADMANESDVVQTFTAVAEIGPTLDIMICNAGINPNRKLGIEEMTLGDWDAVMATNLRGVFLCCRAALPLMRRAPSGRIVLVNSIAGHVTPDRHSPAYRASKHGLRSLATTLAKDLADTPIRVSSIMPGTVATDMVRAHIQSVEKFLQPRDVAEAVMFLLTRPDEVVIPEIIISPRCEIMGGSSPYL